LSGSRCPCIGEQVGLGEGFFRLLCVINISDDNSIGSSSIVCKRVLNGTDHTVEGSGRQGKIILFPKSGELGEDGTIRESSKDRLIIFKEAGLKDLSCLVTRK
jgi:serine acetyltransferase